MREVSMKVVSIDALEWKKDHPTGSLAFKYLLSGDEGAPDNFVLILARQDARFTTERHRHNFDQFRFPIRGDMNVGKGVVLPEGQLGYFTEGAVYGPQDDPLDNAAPGERLHLTLQFGGATGYGYLGPDQLRACRDELRKHGEFVDVLYRRQDGKTLGGLDAVWQHAFGRKLEYPKPRYSGPIIIDPNSFRWKSGQDGPGVERRHLGSFTERGTWAEMVRLQPGARWTFATADARQLLFVFAGAGSANGQGLAAHSSVQIDPGERVDVACTDPIEALTFGLPPVVDAGAGARAAAA
jgi:hypothetical protein